MSNSLFELEYHPGDELVVRIKHPRFRMLPDSTKEHLSAAGQEIMLALRDMLDTAIEKGKKAETAKRKKKIEVK